MELAKLNLEEKDSILDVLSRVFDTNIDGICVSDPSKKDNPLIYVNKSFEQITGYSFHDAVGRNCRFLQGESTDIETVYKLRNTIQAKKPIRTKILNYKKSGESFWNELSISPIYDNKGRVVYYIGYLKNLIDEPNTVVVKKVNETIEKYIADKDYEVAKLNKELKYTIKQKNKAEATSEEAKERFQGLFEFSKDGILFTEINGQITDVNNAYFALTDFSKEELIGLNQSKLTSSKFLKLDHDIIQRVIQTGTPEEYEKEIVKKNGINIPVCVSLSLINRDNNKPLGLAWIIKDITEQQRIQDALKISEAKNRQTISILHEGVIIQDQFGKVVSCNKSAEKILGISFEKLQITKQIFHFKKIVDEEDHELPLNKLPSNIALRTGRSLENVIIGVYATDDKVYWLNVNAEPLFQTGEKKPDGVLISFDDITDRIENFHKLEILNTELRRSNRELEEFASVASHDLQEPLRKIQAFADRLKITLKDEQNPVAIDYLIKLEAASQRMSILINDLLLFSRVSTKPYQFKQVNLNIIINEVISDLEVKIEKEQAKIKVEDLPELEIDPLQFRQLFQNLISNSLKFRSKGRDPRIKVYTVKNDNFENSKITIAVEDNGIGFDEKYKDKIFTVFQRLHGINEYPGTGIGLAVCKKIVDRHKGNIDVKSKLGVGTKFIIELPLKQ